MTNNTELSLILQSLQTTPTVFNEPINWPLFYNLLIQHRVWHQIKNIPTSKQFSQFCYHDKLKILTTASETARIARAFNQRNLLYCVVKGIVLNSLIYQTLYSRPCKDIDVWVDPKTWHEAMSILKTLGYQKKLPDYELKGFKERYYLTHKHDMAFYHPDRKIEVELHFRLSYFGICFYKPTLSMLKTIDLFNTPVTTLHDDYHLLYLMIHGSIHGWMRLRWLHDIALFIKSKRCDLQHVLALSQDIHCEHVVKQSLILAHDLFKLDNDVLCQLIQNPGRRVITLVTLVKQFIASNYVMTDGVGNMNMFVKYRYYLLRLAVKRQKMNAILGDLFKIDMLFKSVTCPEKLAFMYYVLYPGWVVRYVFRNRFRKLP